MRGTSLVGLNNLFRDIGGIRKKKKIFKRDE